ncbi:hypothetical protein MMC25_007763 [Agyrium rufum]|nr:hypothetical protein [Agyrium rufum]
MAQVQRASSLEQEIESLTTRLPDLASLDPIERQGLQKAVQKLGLALETSGDTFQRIAFSPLQLVVARIGVDVGLFKILDSAGPKGRGLNELAEDTKTDPVLLSRLLRYLVVTGAIQALDKTHYAATSVTKSLCNPGSEAGFKLYCDFQSLVFLKLPAYLAKTAYRNPANGLNGPLQYTFDTTLHGFAWIMQPENVEVFKNFNTWLAGSHDGRADWLEWFPVKEEIIDGSNQDREAVAVVDVGGSFGHELLRLKKKFPNLPGRLILQDLTGTINNVPETTVFKPTVHDFFEPQPVKGTSLANSSGRRDFRPYGHLTDLFKTRPGARVYYLRNVLHDWNDDKAKLILENIVSAMKKGYSKIIINEMVVPDTGAGWTETQWDLTMMASTSSMERTQQQWHDLLTTAGLKIVKIWTNVTAIESIIEAVPA